MPLELFAAYYGKKVPTPEVVTYVNERFSDYPELLKNLDNTNNALTIEASKHLNDKEKLGELFNISSGIMEAFGVHTKDIEKFLWELREKSHGVKLSGSGLGDCAIGIVKDGIYSTNSFPISVENYGIKVKL